VDGYWIGVNDDYSIQCLAIMNATIRSASGAWVRGARVVGESAGVRGFSERGVQPGSASRSRPMMAQWWFCEKSASSG